MKIDKRLETSESFVLFKAFNDLMKGRRSVFILFINKKGF